MRTLTVLPAWNTADLAATLAAQPHLYRERFFGWTTGRATAPPAWPARGCRPAGYGKPAIALTSR